MSKKEEQSFFKRLKDSVSYTITGITPKTFFGPAQPLKPLAQEEDQGAQGRAFDYPMTINSFTQPKANEGVNFQKLRVLADSCEIIRTVIETRKDQVSRFKWSFKIVNDKDNKTDPRIEELMKFFKMPDGEHNFDEWMRMILEDLFVIDAPTVYPLLKNNNKPYAFEVIDGSTVKRLIDETGRTPKDGVSPAYQQYLKGTPAVNYTFNELVYKPRNVRAHKIYGYSPVEQVINIITMQLQRTTNQLTYYAEGNVPNLLLRTPPEWTGEQIGKFQRYWDEINSGVNKNSAKFIPAGIEPYDTKPVDLKNEFDEWLARIICFAFSISAQPFIKEMNRATAQTSQQMAEDEGLMPLLEWLKNFIDLLVVKYFGYEDIEFCWNTEKETDPKIKAEIDKIYIDCGVKTKNEVRQELGLKPIDGLDDKPDENEETESTLNTNKFFKKKSNSIKDSEAVKEIESEVESKVFSYLKKQKKYLIDKLNSSDLFKNQVFDDFINTLNLDINDKVTEEFIDDMYSSLYDISLLSGNHAFEMINQKNVNATKQLAQEYAKRRSAELIGKRIDKNGNIVNNKNPLYAISETTRKETVDLIKKAMEEGLSNDELAAEIEENFLFSKKRAKMIARTETNLADNNVTLEAFKVGQVKKKKWLTAKDDRVSEDCMANEAQGEIGIDDLFVSGNIAPPCHPNCRCTILAVFD